MSEGFRPKPRMVFASPLTMGVIGADEPLDVELVESRSADDIRQALVDKLPQGMSINTVELLPPDAPKPRAVRVCFELSVPVERQTAVAERLSHRTDGQTADGCRAEFLDEIGLAEDKLRFTARVTPEGTARPRDLVAWLGLADLEEQGFHLTRSTVELA